MISPYGWMMMVVLAVALDWLRTQRWPRDMSFSGESLAEAPAGIAGSLGLNSWQQFMCLGM
jgi:hypothetical protein